MVNCKRHKASLTAVINSILVLAEIETILQVAADASVDEFAKIIESFRTSQVFTVAVNIADMVRKSIIPIHTSLAQQILRSVRMFTLSTPRL
jgi:hypothetical protein